VQTQRLAETCTLAEVEGGPPTDLICDVSQSKGICGML
jgi:hypothetical protein